MTAETEGVTPGDSVKLCQFTGCLNPGGHGQFGKFCEDHKSKALRDAAKGIEPGTAAPRPKASPSRSGGSALERDIKEALMGTASVVAIANPGIFVAVEATVDEFAAAWANVAKQSPTAEKYIRALLVSGVWLTAASATITMAVAIMVSTGNVPERLVPLGLFVVGKNPSLMQFVRIPAPPAPTTEEE